MVAKSFQSLTQLCEPYSRNKKMYVKVQKKDGGEKEVRWYSDVEYYKLYPEEKKKAEIPSFFEPGGFIYLFKNSDKEEFHNYLYEKIQYRHGEWGWFLPCDAEMPKDLPDQLVPYKVTYEELK